MQIEDNTILIAPGALHLRLYEEIYRQKGSCLNITVLSLDAYISRSLRRSKPSTASILYEYSQALSALPETNPFYGSRKDYDFLKACHSFMTLVQLYGISSFPQSTQQEKDLYEIIELLLPIELWVQQARQLPFEDAKRVRILKTEQDALSAFWVDFLLKKGAQMLSEPKHTRFYSWMASNPHKAMEVCADAIVANGLPAESVLAVLAEPKEKYALAQAFESRNIPYTFVEQDSSSKILSRWQAALRYVMDPQDARLMELLKVLFPASGYDLRRYLELYPQADSGLEGKVYQENALISEEQFEALQELEVQVSPWKKKLHEIQNWTVESFDEIGKLIMEQTPEPDEDDIRIYQGVIDGWEQIRSRIEKPEDLAVFIRSLDALHPSSALCRMEGVLIADRSLVSCLHEHVFWIGADAKHFPGFSETSGIFSEEYLEKLGFSPLEVRMKKRFEKLKSVLEEPRDVYFLAAQSDYEGKDIESSHELNTWLEMLPKFKASAQSSMNLRPAFSFEGLSSRVFFEGDQHVVSTRARQLRSYEDCPLKTLLQYGLHLKKPVRARDVLQVSRRLPAIIMKKALEQLGRPFYTLSSSEILELVRDDFQFAALLIPSRKEEIETLARLCAKRLEWMFEGLRPLCTEMNLTLSEGDYKVDLRRDLQGIPMQISGSIALGSSSHSSFNLYPGDSFGFGGVDAFPAGTLDLSLQPKASSRDAFSVAYGRGAAPACVMPVSRREAADKAEREFLAKALVAQNFESPKPGLMEYLSKRVDTYQEKEELLLQQAEGYANAIVRNDFIPLHKPSACQYCSFRAICRNAAIEKGD